MNDRPLRIVLEALALCCCASYLCVAEARSQQRAPPAVADGSILPFPPAPSASVAGPTLQESTHHRRDEPARVRPDAPNVLIVLLDDVGFGLPETFGGEIHTPALTRLRDSGISYNAFHTTSICSPTRAALLTGRNHQRVGNGTIAERAVDWDGYTGVIPKTSATIAETLHHYGYKTAAFGKWHNTPANQTTAMGPFDRWPTGHGFDYFYGFLAGETSQYEPRLYENLNPMEPPHQRALSPDRGHGRESLGLAAAAPSVFAGQAVFHVLGPRWAHGPHHVFPEWADKYKGKFDDGWDAMRERVFKRQQAMGWIPPSARLTPRAASMASWESIPEAERPFQRRLMEVFAGFVEHTDAQVGKLIDEVERLGLRENTIILYIWGDNGSSAEGQAGSISELLAQNQIPNTVAQQMQALDTIGGLSALGSPKADNMYHAGWAWAGDTPFRSTKLVAAHFGGTRNPLVISWPKGIKPDNTPRSQFHHVNDVVPTLYEVIGIKAPQVVDGFKQDPIDGVSMAGTFADAAVPGLKTTQYFENNGSRGIYHDGWYACAFGPLTPWLTVSPGLATWNANSDVWELYDLSSDYSQFDDLAGKEPERLAKMKELFLAEAKANKVFPVGGGLWTRFHPEDRIGSPYRSWRFDGTTTRMPEFTAPGLGRQSNQVVIDLEVGEEASGVLYALGGASGGLTVFMDRGHLCFEYNMMIIERYVAKSDGKIAAGKHKIEVDTTIAKPGAPAEVILKVDGVEVARTTVKRTVPAAFTASETFDVGVDLGSPVSLEYFDRAPFKLDGKIEKLDVELK